MGYTHNDTYEACRREPLTQEFKCLIQIVVHCPDRKSGDFSYILGGHIAHIGQPENVALALRKSICSLQNLTIEILPANFFEKILPVIQKPHQLIPFQSAQKSFVA